MKKPPSSVLTPVAVALTLSLGLGACTDAKQAAPTYTAPKAPVKVTPPPATNPPVTNPPVDPNPSILATGPGTSTLAVDCDPNKDFAALEFPEKIKACLTQDKVFNYDADACTTMGKALWTCDFATLTTNLTDIELATAPLDKERSNGGKLIGCGASNDGLKIIAQFFYKNAKAPANDCKFSAQGKVVSVCFQKFTDVAPAVPTTDAAKKAYVASCMTE